MTILHKLRTLLSAQTLRIAVLVLASSLITGVGGSLLSHTLDSQITGHIQQVAARDLRIGADNICFLREVTDNYWNARNPAEA